MDRKGEGDCHPRDSRALGDAGKGNVKEGGGVALAPRETKEESLRWSRLEKEVAGAFRQPPGTKTGWEGGRGRGARDARGEPGPAAPGRERSPGWRMRGKWGIPGDGEVREGPRPTRGTKRGGAGLCRRRTESSSSRADAPVGTRRKHGTRGSEGKVHAA